ncbi:uncharacterized protein AUP68_05568 [Ilyonectria robusta]
MADALEDVRPMFDLGKRNYIVTGGAQGIGFAVTRAICEMGGNVAVMDIQEKPVEEFNTLSTKFGAKTVYIRTDVTDESSLTSAFTRALEKLGSIDGCVPCAGIAIDKPFVDQTWDEFTRIQNINVSSANMPHFVLHAVLILKTGTGHILHSTDGCQTPHWKRLRRQHGPYCLAVSPHRATGIPYGRLQRVQGRRDDAVKGPGC